MDISRLVDTDRYPVDVHGSERDALVNSCRDALKSSAICCLPGFLRDTGLAAMTDEMRDLEKAAHRKTHLSTPYAWTDNSGFPEDHPRSALFFRQFSYVLTDQISDERLINRLFRWDVLTDFVRDALDYDTLYRSACPTLSVQLNYMYEGDVLPWHFDTNDGVVSLLLDQADSGGHFEMSPHVREEDDEHYEDVARVFRQDSSLIHKPGMPPGTFILFKGRRSVHRVSPVGATTKPRMIVLYSYDQKPDMTFTEASQARMRNPDSESYLGADTPPGATGFCEWETIA